MITRQSYENELQQAFRYAEHDVATDLTETRMKRVLSRNKRALQSLKQ